MIDRRCLVWGNWRRRNPRPLALGIALIEGQHAARRIRPAEAGHGTTSISAGIPLKT